MKPTRRQLHLTRETIRMLTAPDLGRVAGGRRDTPITPECPSEPTMCVASCSD